MNPRGGGAGEWQIDIETLDFAVSGGQTASA